MSRITSIVLAGQTLGTKEIDDGIWLFSFIGHGLGYVELEQRTRQKSHMRCADGFSMDPLSIVAKKLSICE